MAHAHAPIALAPTCGTRARVSSSRTPRCAAVVPPASRGDAVGRTAALSERAAERRTELLQLASKLQRSEAHLSTLAAQARHAEGRA